MRQLIARSGRTRETNRRTISPRSPGNHMFAMAGDAAGAAHPFTRSLHRERQQPLHIQPKSFAFFERETDRSAPTAETEPTPKTDSLKPERSSARNAFRLHLVSLHAAPDKFSLNSFSLTLRSVSFFRSLNRLNIIDTRRNNSAEVIKIMRNGGSGARSAAAAMM